MFREMRTNALTHAIYDALRAAEAVALSYAEAEANGMLWGEWLAESDALREGELPPKVSRERRSCSCVIWPQASRRRSRPKRPDGSFMTNATCLAVTMKRRQRSKGIR